MGVMGIRDWVNALIGLDDKEDEEEQQRQKAMQDLAAWRETERLMQAASPAQVQRRQPEPQRPQRQYSNAGIPPAQEAARVQQMHNVPSIPMQVPDYQEPEDDDDEKELPRYEVESEPSKPLLDYLHKPEPPDTGAPSLSSTDIMGGQTWQAPESAPLVNMPYGPQPESDEPQREPDDILEMRRRIWEDRAFPGGIAPRETPEVQAMGIPELQWGEGVQLPPIGLNEQLRDTAGQWWQQNVQPGIEQLGELGQAGAQWWQENVQKPRQEESERAAAALRQFQETGQMPEGMDVGDLVHFRLPPESPTSRYLEERWERGKAETEGRFWPRLGAHANAAIGSLFEYPGKELTTTPLDELGARLAGGEMEEPGQAPTLTALTGAPAAGEILNRFQANFPWAPQRYFGVEPIAPGEMWSEFQRQRDRLLAVEREISENREEKPIAALALYNAWSGADRAERTRQQLVSQPSEIERLRFEAERAANQGNSLLAAELYHKSNQLAEKTPADIVDDNMNLWAEFIGGLLDPVAFGIGKLHGLGGTTISMEKASKADKILSIPGLRSEATQKITNVVKKGRSMYDLIMEGIPNNRSSRNPINLNPLLSPIDRRERVTAEAVMEEATRKAGPIFDALNNNMEAIAAGSVDVRKWWEKTPVLRWPVRSPQTMAGMDADFIWRSLRGMAQGTNDKRAVQSLFQRFADDPVGLLNDYSWSVMAPLDPAEVSNLRVALRGEIDTYADVLTSRIAALKEFSPRIAKLKSLQGEGPINWDEFDVEVLENLYAAAKKMYGDPEEFRLNPISRGVKGFMSFTWLLTSLPNIIRNAFTGNQMAVSTGTFTWRNTDHFLNDIAHKFGRPGVTPRIFEAVTGREIGRSLAAGTEVGIGNRVSEWLATNGWWGPYGMAEHGPIPIGEQAHFIRHFGKAFQTDFRRRWQMGTKALQQRLIDRGIDPAVAKQYASEMSRIGVEGNADDIRRTIRELTKMDVLPTNMGDLGIPPELIMSNENRNFLTSILRGEVPGTAEELIEQVRRIFDTERFNLQPIQGASPAEFKFPFVQDEVMVEGTRIIENLVQEARRLGLDPTETRQQVTEFFTNNQARQLEAYQRFRDELAGTFNIPAAWEITMDFLGDYWFHKATARQAVDELGRIASGLSGPEARRAWARKWQETQRIYDEVLVNNLNSAADRYRGYLREIDSPEYVYRSNGRGLRELIARWQGFDIEALRQARQAGVWRPTQEQQAFENLLNLNRQKIDAATARLFETYRLNPSLDNLDLVWETLRRLETMGAEIAHYMGPVREQAYDQNNWDAFYALSNQLWNAYYDAGAVLQDAMSRTIIGEWVMEQSRNGMRWFDEASGMEFQLIAPRGRNVWEALRLDDNTRHYFRAPDANVELPPVPEELIQRWNSAIDQAPEETQRLFNEIFELSAQTYRRAQEVTGQAQPTIESGAQILERAMRAGRKAQEKGEPIVSGLGTRLEQAPPDVLKLLDVAGITENIESFDDLYRLVHDAVRSSKLHGNIMDGIGDANRRMVDGLDMAERRFVDALRHGLPQIPNNVPMSERQRIVDIVDDMIPEYEKALRVSLHVGEQMGNFNMLNFADKRNIDYVMAQWFPFPYFWSRMPSRGIEAAMTNPALVNFFYEWQRITGIENEQSNVPRRLRGTLPNPLSVLPIAEDFQDKEFMGWLFEERVNPVYLAIPYMQYLRPSPFVDPSEAVSGLEEMKMRIEQWMPGWFPHIGMAADGIFDILYPRSTPNELSEPFADMMGELPNKPWLNWIKPEKPRGQMPRINQWQAGDWLGHLGRIAGYAYAMHTGNMPIGSNINVLQGWQPLSLGDEFDYGRFARPLARMVARGEVTPEMAAWALDVGHQLKTGDPPMGNQPDGAIELWEQAVEEGATERMHTMASRWWTGVPTYDWSEEEELIRQLQRDRRGMYFDEETQPYGSKAVTKEFSDQPIPGAGTPEGGEQPTVIDALSTLWTGYDLYPQGSGPPPDRPGVSAETSMWYDAIGRVSKAFRGAEEQAMASVMGGPETPSNQEMYEAENEARIAVAREMLGDDVVDGYLAENPKADGYDLKQLAYDMVDEQFPNAKPQRKTITGATPEELRQMFIEDLWDQYQAWTGRPPDEEFPEYPGYDATDAQWNAYNQAKDEWMARKEAWQNERDEWFLDSITNNPSALAEDEDPQALLQALKDRGKSAAELEAREINAQQAAEEEKWSVHWDAWSELGDDNAAKAEYRRQNPDFAAYQDEWYKEKGYENPWKDNLGYGGEGEAAGGAFSQQWDEYRALGDDWNAKYEYLLSHPEFMAHYRSEYDDGDGLWFDDYIVGGSRTGHYYGGYFGGGGGWSWGSGDEKPSYIDRGTPWQARYIQPREFSGYLMPTLPPPGQREWRPPRPADQWLQAGSILRP